VPFHIIGNVQPEIFNSISTNATLNIIFFIVFIFFSISFLAILKLPCQVVLPIKLMLRVD